MAYVALSRTRTIEQLHLWGFDLDAIHADRRIAREYTRLAHRPLTAAHVAAAQLRVGQELLPLSVLNPVQDPAFLA